MSSLKIKISADERSSFTVMFEPSGMSYDLSGSEFMFAEFNGIDANELEVIYWDGGMSFWPPGPVVTFDSEGIELHRL